MFSVSDVAEAAGVTTAAVRGRLLAGTLRGRRVQRGSREVWEVFPDAAQAYIASRGRVSQVQEQLLPEDEVMPHVAPRAGVRGPDGGGGLPAGGGGGDGALDAVLDENVRLRQALGALQRSQRELLEVVSGLLDG